MALDTRLAAFTEYVLRPMSEDWRIIAQELKQLKGAISPGDIRTIVTMLGIWHLTCELLRMATYLGVAYILATALVKIWPAL